MAEEVSLSAAAPAVAWAAPRKLTHDEARMEQRVYWAGKSVAERLAAMTELNRRMYAMRGIDLDEYKTDFTVSRVRRSRIGTSQG